MQRRQQTRAAGVRAAPPQPGAESRPGRVRLLLVASAPFLLLLVLTAGIRLAERLSALGTGDDADRLLRGAAGARPTRPVPPRPPASPADPATQSAIEGAIRGQLDAFGRADYRAALGFALPEMRDSWSPDEFGRMVEDGYAVMCEAKSSGVERAQVRGGREAEARVVVTGRSGARAGYLYRLVKAGDRWCVGGVSATAPAGRPGGGDTPPRRRGGEASPRPAGEPGRRVHPRPPVPSVDIRDV